MKYIDHAPGELNMQPGMDKVSRFRDFVGGVASAMDNEIQRRREEKRRLQAANDPNATEQIQNSHINVQQYGTEKRKPTAADSLKLHNDASLLEYFTQAGGATPVPNKGPRPVSKNEINWKHFLQNAEPYKQKHAVPIVDRILKLSEETGIQPAGHYRDEIPSPYFKPPVNGSNAFMESLKELEKRKNLKMLQYGDAFSGGEAGNFTQGLPQEEGQNSSSSQNPNADTTELPAIDGLPPEQQGQAAVAFEAGEVLMDPANGAVLEVDKDLPNNHRHDAKGKKHSYLPAEFKSAPALEDSSAKRANKRTETQQFDKALQIPKEELQEIADAFNLGVKIKQKYSTHASAFKQINEGLMKQRKLMQKYVMDVNSARQPVSSKKAARASVSANRNTNGSRHDKYGQNTLAANTENYNRLPTEQDIFGALYQRQESMKEAISRRLGPGATPWDNPEQNQIAAPDSVSVAQYGPPTYDDYTYPKTTRRSEAMRRGLLENGHRVTSGEFIVPDLAGNDLAAYYSDLANRSKATVDEFTRSFQDVQPFVAGGGNTYGDVAKFYSDGKQRPIKGAPLDPEDPLYKLYRNNHEWAFNLNPNFNPHNPDDLKWFQTTHKQYIGDYFGDKDIDGAFGHQTRMAPLLRVRTNDPKKHLTKDLTRPYIYYYDQQAPKEAEAEKEALEAAVNTPEEKPEGKKPAPANQSVRDGFPAYNPLADASSIYALMQGRAPVNYIGPKYKRPVRISEDPTAAYQASLAASNLASKNLTPSQAGINAALQAQSLEGINQVTNSYRQANNAHLGNFLNQVMNVDNMQSQADAQTANMLNDLTQRSQGIYGDRMVQLMDNLASNRMDYQTFIENLKILRNMNPAADVRGGYSGYKYNFTPGATIPQGTVASGVTTKYNPKTKQDEYYRNGKKLTASETEKYLSNLS